MGLILVYGDVTDHQARLISIWGSDQHGDVDDNAVDVSARSAARRRRPWSRIVLQVR